MAYTPQQVQRIHTLSEEKKSELREVQKLEHRIDSLLMGIDPNREGLCVKEYTKYDSASTKAPYQQVAALYEDNGWRTQVEFGKEQANPVATIRLRSPSLDDVASVNFRHFTYGEKW